MPVYCPEFGMFPKKALPGFFVCEIIPESKTGEPINSSPQSLHFFFIMRMLIRMDGKVKLQDVSVTVPVQIHNPAFGPADIQIAQYV